MKKQSKEKHELMNIFKSNLLNLPTPSAISYMWNMGSMLGMTLMIQIISGTLLAMHFSPSESTAFSSVIEMARNINDGMIIRAIHSNMASVFFALIYIHIFRGIINTSFKKKDTWASGTSMVLILMATAFLGYVLPWGQMSFWGATVITNLASTVPIIGEEIVQWLWGGYSVSHPTINRFFPLHFILPFILTAMAILHMLSLHSTGSSNPTGTISKMDMTSFHPLFSWKDILAPSILVTTVIIISNIKPDIMMDSENFMMANPMNAPIHIQPEWYFLFAYAILRAIPNKMGGVIALVSSILVIMVPSTKANKKSSSKYNPSTKMMKMTLVASFVSLTILGAKPMEEPFTSISQITSMIYFYSIM